MSDFRLVVPSKEYESQAFEYIQEFLEYNSEINGTGGLDRYDNYDEWLLKLERALDIPNIPEGKVPANTYFFVRTLDNRIIGMINIRHKLNEFLLNEAGHIGYSIRPTERRKGYGTLMLELGLEKCKELNINKILITCDKSNAASAKVIQNNNGVLENEVFSETFSEIIQRYWIKLSKITHQEEIVNKASVSFDSYEEMAEHYFKNVDTKPFNAYYERPATISLLPDVKGKKVLDAACAAGWYTKWLLDNEASVIAVDFSPSMIEMTKKRVGDRAEIIRADLNNPLSFIEDEAIDIVLSSLTLHYIRDWKLVMSEFSRILKKDGQLIFSVHHPFKDFTVHNKENYFSTELLEEEWSTNNGKVKVQFYRRPLSKIISSVIDAGFIVEKLLEPMPTEQFKIAKPDTYDILTKRPQFLFIRARKA